MLVCPGPIGVPDRGYHGPGPFIERSSLRAGELRLLRFWVCSGSDEYPNGGRRDDRSIQTTQGQELQFDYRALPIVGECRNAQELRSGCRGGGRPGAGGILQRGSRKQPGSKPAGKRDARTPTAAGARVAIPAVARAGVSHLAGLRPYYSRTIAPLGPSFLPI